MSKKTKILIVAGLPDLEISVKFDKTSQNFSVKFDRSPQSDFVKFDGFVGVDYGALWLLRHDLPLDLAVGDFDSMSESEFELMSKLAGQLVHLPSHKNETDLEVAYDLALSREELLEAEVTVLGALGGRLDHLLTNVFMPTHRKYASLATRLTLIDRQNWVRYLQPGTHILPRIADKKYIGFVQIDTAQSLAISGAKYSISAAENFNTIYASNEFLTDTMTVSFNQGSLIVIYSNDLEK